MTWRYVWQLLVGFRLSRTCCDSQRRVLTGGERHVGWGTGTSWCRLDVRSGGRCGADRSRRQHRQRASVGPRCRRCSCSSSCRRRRRRRCRRQCSVYVLAWLTPNNTTQNNNIIHICRAENATPGNARNGEHGKRVIHKYGCRCDRPSVKVIIIPVVFPGDVVTPLFREDVSQRFYKYFFTCMVCYKVLGVVSVE